MTGAGAKGCMRAGRPRAALLALWLAAPLVAAEVRADGVPQRDWKNLSARELTFIPEAEKKPALDNFLAGETWDLDYASNSAEWCRRILDRVLAWQDVEILEPDIRTNDIDDPQLDFLRESCPDLRPEVLDKGRNIVATHGFRVFFVDKSEQGQLLIFGRVGANTPKRIEEAGYEFENNSPDYILIDTNSCDKQSFSTGVWTNFGFYMNENGLGSDAFMSRIGEEIVWIGYNKWSDKIPSLSEKNIYVTFLGETQTNVQNYCSFKG